MDSQVSTFKRLEDYALEIGLVVSAIAPLETEDGLEQNLKSVALLSPHHERFWDVYSTSTEASDGEADPIDRWSLRAINQLATPLGGKPLFPFAGPPYYPFSRWAQRARVAWQSPPGLLVHARYGLWISFRGAIAFEDSITKPPESVSPCLTCPKPCLHACPVNALVDSGYHYQRCHEHVRSDGGFTCRHNGCLARRACPIGIDLVPPQAQIELHMAAFAAT